MSVKESFEVSEERCAWERKLVGRLGFLDAQLAARRGYLLISAFRFVQNYEDFRQFRDWD